MLFLDVVLFLDPQVGGVVLFIEPLHAAQSYKMASCTASTNFVKKFAL